MSLLDLRLSEYSELTEIGRGGSGTVYRARQDAFGRDVAIKLLRAGAGPEAIERFRSECTSIGALSGHPNIVTVHGVGTADDGRPFLVMELLPGGSLADRLAEDGPLPWPEVVAIGVKLAGTLESAHRAGVLHCDVKPEHVLLTRFGELKLVDFGVAQMFGAGTAAPGGLRGTPAHAAPEVLAGMPVTPRSEIYSLASTLVTLLSGRPPLAGSGDSLVRLAADAAAGGRPALDDIDVPDQLRTVLEGALATDPDDRPSDAARFGRQLQAVQSARGLAITPLPIEHDGTEGSPMAPGRPGRSRFGRRRTVLPWRPAAALGVVLAVATVVALRPGSDGASSSLAPIFQDNFDAGQGWYEYEDDVASLGYESGEYRISIKQAHHTAVSDSSFRGPTFGVPLTMLDDVSVEVSARALGGRGLFGATCRQAAGATAYYVGLVAGDGVGRIAKYHDEQLEVLAAVDVPRPDAARPTRVRLDCIGGPGDTRLSLFVDGDLAATASDRQALARGSVGLAAASGASDSVEVRFDDLSVLGRVDAGR